MVERQGLSQPDPTRPPIPTVRFVNGEHAEIVGGEVGVDVRIIDPWLTGFLNYSYQDRTPNRLLNLITDPAPQHKGNAGLTFAFPNGFSATLLVHRVGESERKVRDHPYTLVNLHLGHRFTVVGQEMEAAIHVFNLFNDVHSEVSDGDLIERRLAGTLRYRF